MVRDNKVRSSRTQIDFFLQKFNQAKFFNGAYLQISGSRGTLVDGETVFWLLNVIDLSAEVIHETTQIDIRITLNFNFQIAFPFCRIEHVFFPYFVYCST